MKGIFLLLNVAPGVTYLREHTEQLEYLRSNKFAFLFALEAFSSIVISGRKGGLLAIHTGAKGEGLRLFLLPWEHTHSCLSSLQ